MQLRIRAMFAVCVILLGSTTATATAAGNVMYFVSAEVNYRLCPGLVPCVPGAVVRVFEDSGKLETFIGAEEEWQVHSVCSNSEFVCTSEANRDETLNGPKFRSRIYTHDGKLLKTLDNAVWPALNFFKTDAIAFVRDGRAYVLFLKGSSEERMVNLSPVINVAWDTDGGSLYLQLDTRVVKWNLDKWDIAASYEGQQGVNYSKDGALFYGYREEFLDNVFVAATGEILFSGTPEVDPSTDAWVSCHFLLATSLSGKESGKKILLDCRSGREWRCQGLFLGLDEKAMRLSFLASPGNIQSMVLTDENACTVHAFEKPNYLKTGMTSVPVKSRVFFRLPEAVKSKGPYELCLSGAVYDTNCCRPCFTIEWLRVLDSGTYTIRYTDQEGNRQDYGPIELKVIPNEDSK